MCKKSGLNHITSSVSDGAKKIFGDKLRSVILYGSYARGDYDSTSDVDIFLLLDIPKEQLWKYRDPVSDMTSRLSLEDDDCTTISVHKQDTETFEQYRNVLPFFKNVLNEGVLLYERA